MIDQKQVELLIQARLKGGRDLESITKSIAELEKALESQAEAARRGEKSFDGLKAAQEALKQVQEELGARGKALQDFQKLTETVKEQEKAVAAATNRLQEFEKTLGAEKTKKQEKELSRLTKSLQGYQDKLGGTQQAFLEFEEALRKSGVNLSDLSGEIRRNQDAIISVDSAYNKAGQEIVNYSANVTKAKDATRELARQQELLQRFQAGNEADARLAAEQRVAAIKKVEQAEADRLAIIQRAAQIEQQTRGRARADSELAAIRESEEFTRRYLENQKKIEEANKRDAGLRKTADDAEAAARGYSTLARASTDLRPKIVSIADAIKQITQPAQESVRTLAGVEGQIKEVATAVGGIKGPVADAAAQLQRLRDAQRAIEQQAGLIDNFRKQAQALRETEQALFKAESEFAKYAAEVRKGGDSAQKFVSELAKAKGQVESTSNALRRQRTITEEAARSLEEIGIDSRNLGEAQERLARGARTATEATKTLTNAVKQYGNETARAEGKAKGVSLFRDEGRTTLSLAQRIRGEVLALTASYVGLQGAIGLAADSLRVFNQNQAIQNAIGFGLGVSPDSGRVADEIRFIRQESDRLGVSYEALSKSYGKFLSSATRSGAPLAEVKQISQGVNEVARVLNLTADETEGVYRALTQSFSIGKIQAEELNQLSERLPGAFGFAQQALAGQFPSLKKALEEGKVDAENILIIIESMRKAAQSALGPALKSLDAEQNRFNNSVRDFKTLIAEGGFAESYTALLKDLRDFFQSDDGKAFAQGISDALSLVLNSFRSLLSFAREYSSELKAIATALLWFGAIKATQTLVGKLADFVKAVRAGEVAVSRLQRAFIVIQLIFAAVQIGKYFYEEFKIVRESVAAFVGYFLKAVAFLDAGLKTFWAEIPRWAENAFKSAINSATFFMRTLLAVFAAGARALGLGPLAETISKAIDTLTLKTNNAVSSRVVQIQDELEQSLKNIKKLTDSMVNGDAAPTVASAQQPFSDARFASENAASGRKGKSQGPTEAEIKKRQDEVKALQDAIRDIETRILRANGESLNDQLRGVDERYKDLEDRISALGGKDAVRLAAALEAAKGKEKLKVIQDFNKKAETEQEALIKKVEQKEIEAGRRSKDSLTARLGAVKQEYDQLYADIDRLISERRANGLDTAELEQARESLKVAKEIKDELTKQAFIKDELESRERQVNDLLRARRDSIELIRQQEEAGLITSEEADKRVKDAIANLQPQIDALVTLGYEFAASIQGAFDPAAIERFVARLQLAKQSGKNLNDELDKTRKFGADDITKIVDSGLDGFIKAIEEAAAGTAKWGDIFQATGRAILGTIAEILKEIAKAIIKQQILNALRSIGVPVAHSGMVVGQGSNRSRNVAPGLFSLAPRYHTGGIVGLRPDEYPAILQKNEEVLSTSDPRNVLNGGMSAGKAPAAPSQRFVLVDDRSRVAEAMAGAEGEEVTIMHLRKNIPTLRALLKG